MSPKQREAAARLIKAFDKTTPATPLDDLIDLILMNDAIELLRELLAEPETWSVEECNRAIKTLLYVQGIVERGEGRPMRDDETLEAFVLGYVKRLELLAEPVQEPVAEIFDTFGNSQDPTKCQGNVWLAPGYFPPRGTKLYAAPQQRKPLTDEQIDRLDTQAIHGGPDSQYAFRFARAIEKAHGITGEPT